MRKMMAIGGAVCAAALTLTSGAAMATQPEDGATFEFPNAPTVELSTYVLVDGHKVTYCHRTGSAGNPYVIITSDLASVNDIDDPITTDHQHHQQVGNGLGPDVIPVSMYPKKEFIESLDVANNKELREYLIETMCVVDDEPPSYPS